MSDKMNDEQCQFVHAHSQLLLVNTLTNMLRPQSKEELVLLSSAQFDKLQCLVDSYDAEEQRMEFPKGTMNRNIRDILAYLDHWHRMMLKWYNEGMAGNKPEMPAPGYTWLTVPKLNREIWEMHRNTDLEIVKGRLNESYEKVKEVIASHTNEELFTKKLYPWTGSTSLGSYLTSTTSSHYDWAYKFIRKAMKDSVISNKAS